MSTAGVSCGPAMVTGAPHVPDVSVIETAAMAGRQLHV